MVPMTHIRGFVPFIIIVALQAAIALGHSTVIFTAIAHGYSGPQPIFLTAGVNCLVLLPLVLLFSPAGYISDKFPKSRVMRHASLAGVLVTLVITGSFYLGWFEVAFGLTLLLAIQNAIYTPAKNGHIRELVGSENLAVANGVVQAASVIGILAGVLLLTSFNNYLLGNTEGLSTSETLKVIAASGWLLVALAVTAWLLSFRLRGPLQTLEERSFKISEYLRLRYLRKNLQTLRAQRPIRSAVVGLATFWTIAQIVLVGLPSFYKGIIHEGSSITVPIILACAGVGIIVGSIMAGRVSRNYLETGLIPFAALGMALLIALAPSIDTPTGLLLVFLGFGVSGGLFIVPLNALIQFHAQDDQLGTVSAGRSWFQATGMLLGVVLAVAFYVTGMEPANLLYTMAVVAVIGVGYTVRELPHSLTRIIALAVLKHRYGFAVLGFKNLPRSGAVLLLGNHTSWVDWALVQIACPRPVRFVLEHHAANSWYVKLFFRLTGTSAISGRGKKSPGKIRKLLKAGKVVCLFPEGAISGNGQLGDFHSAYEHITEDLADGVIIPFYLRGLWGSKFSRADVGLRDSRAPSLRRDLIVAFGKPLPLDTRADHLKQKVFDLSITAWESYTKTLDPLPLAWLKTVRNNPGDVCTVDASEVRLSRRRFAAATLVFSKAMNLVKDAENVGLLLPASNAAAIANMAVMLKGRAAVNLNFSASAEAVNAGIVEAGIRQVYTSKQFETRLEARGADFKQMLDGVEVHYMEDIRERIPKWRLISSLLQVSLLPAPLLYRLHGRRASLEDPAAILFSSGSEGKPKGVVLSHRNIQSNCKQISDVLNTRVDDVMMASLPPFHAFGLTVTLLMPLVEGIPIACHPDPTDVLGIARSIAKYRATILFGTATFLSLYARNRKIDSILLDSLRLVVAGAEKLPDKVRHDFQLKFNKHILEGYGATETTPVASVNVPDAVDTDDWNIQLGEHEGSVGLPLPGTSFKIVDPTTHEELPLGEDGMILISGNQVMLGYLNDLDKTREAIFEHDGMRWYITGDKGHITPEGFLLIVDRYSRFAKIGGEMVSLGAVEECARGVLEENSEEELAAAALPDARKGEKIVILVTSQQLEQSLREKMVAAGTPPLMLPSQVIEVADIPKLGSGKTDFSALNALAATAAAQAA
jgi:acyl-[acyl-carrier-protein]-phospholipid O-acyltransferase/long-chain-fatty-acid--[acyl-carrier-protein] ligase